MADTYDLIFAGGGLASCLTAYRLATVRPDWRIAIVEAGGRLGGDHTWSFHDSDVSAEDLSWLGPFVVHRWEGQRVRFPKRERTLSTGYLSVTSNRLHDVTSGFPGIDILTGASVTRAEPGAVTLADQRRLSGAVLDGRGAVPSPHLSLGFQKFLGHELRTRAPHGVATPMIMDATVPQTDGYRFVYVLPLSEDVLHVEDTYYADGNDLPKEALRREIAAYAAREGWDVAEVVREEDGILPIVLEGDFDAYWDELRGGPAPIGMRAGLFNQITGYSLPEAVMLAEYLADELRDGPPPTPRALFGLIEEHAKRVWTSQSFYRVLNRMLFRAADPHLRYVVLQRHYGLSQGLIERFYAGRSTWADKARILAGKPPVSVRKAIKALPPKRSAA